MMMMTMMMMVVVVVMVIMTMVESVDLPFLTEAFSSQD